MEMILFAEILVAARNRERSLIPPDGGEWFLVSFRSCIYHAEDDPRKKKSLGETGG